MSTIAKGKDGAGRWKLKTAPPVTLPKPPGRVSLAAKRRREHTARTVMPYAGTLAVAAGADLALHQPVLLGLGAGAGGDARGHPPARGARLAPRRREGRDAQAPQVPGHRDPPGTRAGTCRPRRCGGAPRS